MERKNMICIVCPIGCHLEVERIDEKVIVTGNQCNRGQAYGIKELTNPTRVLTSTVKVNNAHLSRLPIKTEGGVPKHKISQCIKEINSVELNAPVKLGQVVIKNIQGTGVDVIASRSI